VTHRQPTTRLGWWRLLLAAIAAALTVLLGAGTASAVTVPVLETRVGASTPTVARVVGVHECITAGQRWGNAPPAAVSVVATGVAAKAEAGAVRACEGGLCGIPGKTCFVAGTLIRTERGDIPIEKVQVGDKVWSRNIDTGKDELQPVVETYVRHADALLRLTVAGSVLTTTADHPFMVKDRGWVKAGDLQVGDVLVTPTGTAVLSGIEHVAHGATVYNFQVAVNHDYYALADTTPILVHNANYGYTPRGGAADFDLDELAQLTHQHVGAGDIPGRPSLAEIRTVLERGAPTSIRSDAVQLDFQGVRVIVNESMPWKSTAYYPGS
jgi:hypothetical protein